MQNILLPFSSVDELQDLLHINEYKNEQKLFLGGGSNILFTKNFDGIVLKNEIGGIETIHEDEKYVYVKVGAGVNWHQFVLHCINKNFGWCRKSFINPGQCRCISNAKYRCIRSGNKRCFLFIGSISIIKKTG